MSETINYTVRAVNDGDEVTKTVSLSDDSVTKSSFDVAASQTDEQHTIAIDVSKATFFYLQSSQDCTIETNSGGAADSTLTVLANVPILWYTGCTGWGYAHPCDDADVTDFFVTTGAISASAEIEVWSQENSEP